MATEVKSLPVNIEIDPIEMKTEEVKNVDLFFTEYTLLIIV